MAKIYVSGNYLIVDSPDGLTEFACKQAVYNITGKNISIKQDNLKINIPLSEVANYTNEAGNTPYTIATLTTFLRANTGNFSSASGGSGAETLNYTIITTSTYTLQPTDAVLSIETRSTNLTLTLPLAADHPYRVIYVKRGSNTDSATVAIVPTDEDLIELVSGGTTNSYTLGTVSTARRTIFISNGVNKWCILSNN